MKLSRRIRVITNRLGLSRPGKGFRPGWEPRLHDTRLMTAIEAGDLQTIRQVFASHPENLTGRTVFAGGTWLHYAAGCAPAKSLGQLIELGMDVNQPGYQEGDLALCSAASQGQFENAAFLLEKGSRIDTSKSVRNPLFAAIVGQSSAIVNLLLDYGIDPKVRYNSKTMRRMDAMAFALFRGSIEGEKTLQLAVHIANHISAGNVSEMSALLDDAEKRSRLNGTPKLIRLVPTEQDLRNMR